MHLGTDKKKKDDVETKPLMALFRIEKFPFSNISHNYYIALYFCSDFLYTP